MIYNWLWLGFFLLTVKCAWSLKQSEYGLYWTTLYDPYTNIFSPISATNRSIYKSQFTIQMTQTHKFGLPKCSNQQNECRKIGIVGAGAAGLYCGILLAQAGHTVIISEASNRAGGRVFTYRDPQNPSLYMGELGAMRFPLTIQTYVNTLIRQRYKLNVTELITSNDNAYGYFNGIRATQREFRENPDIFKFNTSQSERGKSASTLWLDAIQPILDTLEQGGWLSVKNQWDSFSIDSYLNKLNLSQGARDYINSYRVTESASHLSILEYIRATLLLSSEEKFYLIQGGSDRLIQAMVSECQSIELNRCSIVYSTPISQIQLHDPNTVHWRTQNGTNDTFNRIIVATTATAAQLIDFNNRIDFIEKYQAFRRLHYICSTKILLFFNVSWWYTQENINGGLSITDLNIRQVFYPYTTNNATNGGTVLATYISGYESLFWQSLAEADVIELALKQLIQLHRSSSNMRDYFQGGKAHHWCGDPYAHGAFARFSPFQETRLFYPLQASVSNVDFIGEHTSLIHAWIEGAIVSALRAALDITAKGERVFDVIIMGGNPVGLTTAIFLSLKDPSLRIAIVEKGTIVDTNSSSEGTFHQRQFRQIYNEKYLTELANMSVSFWRQLEQLANMSLGSILNTNDGFLFFGDLNSSRSTIEGDLLSIKRTCDNLTLGCEYLNSTQLQTRYPIFTLPSNYQGIFHHQSGYINVTMLMMGLLRIINQNPNIIIRQQEEFLSFKLFDNQSQIVTDRGVLYASRKVLFLPGLDVKNTSNLLNFDLNVTLWELPIYYFRRLLNVTQLPTWLAFGNHDQQSLFSGFSIDSTSDYIVIKPKFIQNLSNSLISPWQRTNLIDPLITQRVLEWVSIHMRTWINISDYYSYDQTYLSPFLPGNGFLLDYVPRTNKRMLIQASVLDTSFVPIWADILSDMTLFEMNSSSKYAKYIDYFSLPQANRLTNNSIISNKGYQLTYSLSALCGLVCLVHYLSTLA